MMNTGCFRMINSKWKFSRTSSVFLVLLFSSISISLYMLAAIQSCTKCDILNTIQIFGFRDKPTQNRTSYSHSGTSSIPKWKSEKWYLSAIKRLAFKKVTPSTLLLEQPYFNPNPSKRFEAMDNEVISSPKCLDRTRLVVLILSEPHTMDSRKAIRQTWGSVASWRSWPWVNFKMDIRLLFVVGVPGNDSGESSPSSKPQRNYSLQQLQTEAEEFNDILQVSTIDSYANLTRKVISGFKWIAKNCAKARYVVKADQDVFVNVPLLWQFLSHYGRNNSIYGHIYFHGYVRRRGRWGLPQAAVPIDLFPAYASGTSYVLSLDAVVSILRTYYFFPYVQIEDAFITGIVASVAKIDRYNVKGFAHWSEMRPDSCEIVMDRVYTANQVNVTSIRGIWSEVNERGNGRCL